MLGFDLSNGNRGGEIDLLRVQQGRVFVECSTTSSSGSAGKLKDAICRISFITFCELFKSISNVVAQPLRWSKERISLHRYLHTFTNRLSLDKIFGPVSHGDEVRAIHTGVVDAARGSSEQADPIFLFAFLRMTSRRSERHLQAAGRQDW